MGSRQSKSKRQRNQTGAHDNDSLDEDCLLSSIVYPDPLDPSLSDEEKRDLKAQYRNDVYIYLLRSSAVLARAQKALSIDIPELETAKHILSLVSITVPSYE